MLAVLLLAGCSAPEDKAQATATASTGAGSEASAAASAKPAAVAFADNAEQDGGTREFAYKWPAAVSAIPALAERLAADRDKALAEQKADWAGALAEFPGEDCISCKNLSFAKEWKVVTDLPRYLSLSADIYLYTGGAHGNSAFETLVWDREAGTAIKPEAMFTSEAGLQDALGDGWCKALKAERIKRIGADLSEDGFFPCPAIADLTVLLGSSNRKAFNRIGLIAAPYVAGSYAEGPYEVTLPVTPKVIAAVKPEYKAAFAPET
ncbi:MAG: hypothetical protein OHK0018_16670 [Erythrobacter tepidarius]